MYLKHMNYKLKRGIAALGTLVLLLQAPFGHLGMIDGRAQTVSGNEVVSANTTEGLLLNYAYIEKAQMDVADAQNVLISVGDGDVEWKTADLTLVNETTEERRVLSFADSMEDVLRFSVDTTGWNTGVYRVEKLAYTYNVDGFTYADEMVFARIADMGDVCFGVGVENPIADEEFSVYDAEGKEKSNDLMDVNVISLTGEEENLDASEKVAEAVEQAEANLAGAEVIAAESGKGPADADEVLQNRKKAESLVVMLDPGHDATHAGARANGLQEETLTLKVAQYCKAYLEDKYSDVVVYMTRQSGACPYPGTSSGDCNAARVDDAKNKGADVYVSLHFNSTAGTTTATGAIVFYPNSNYNSQAGSSGAQLATKIIAQLEKLGLKNNGIRIRNSENKTLYPDGSLADYYGVIKRSKEYGIPAVIVEHAFINNPSDAAFLSKEENLESLGVADALGIAEAYGLSTEAVEFEAADLQVKETVSGNGIFKMTLSGASPVKKIKDVKFQVYPTDAKKKSYEYTAELTNKVTGTYEAVGNVGNHGKLSGKYKVIAYAYNAAGKKTQLLSTTFSLADGPMDTTGMTVTAKVPSKEKQVTLKLKGSPDAAGVSFRVYGSKKGDNDAKDYEAEKLANGQWSAKIKIADHKEMGDYVVEAYVTNYFGTAVKAVTSGFKIEGPSVKKIQVKKLNLNQGTFRVVVNKVTSKSGVKNVTVTVKTLDQKKVRKIYTPKKAKSGYYYIDVNMKDFKYQFGRYGIYVKVKDNNGIEETVKELIYEIKQPQPVITAKLKSRQTKIGLSASQLGIGVDVKGVKFKVTASGKKKTYELKSGKNGVYTATVSVADFKKSGKYKIVTYVKGADGKYKKIGTAKTITVADIEGGAVKVKQKTSGSSILDVTGIQYKGEISSVQVKAWPKSNTKAKFTYKAKKRSNGTYRVTVDTKNHKETGGDYRYQVIVTAKNGIEKKLLQGTFQMGKTLPVPEGLYEISGTSCATVEQMMNYYQKNATYPTYYSVSDAPTLKKFCQLYYKECEAEGIRAEVAFAQAMKETNFLRFGGDVSITQFNFAGLGATGGGEPGLSFESVQIGIRAQVQHLKAYANTDPLNQACVDPRFQYVQRGCAPYVEWLGIKENPYGKGWAADPTYGSSLRLMITSLLNNG